MRTDWDEKDEEITKLRQALLDAHHTVCALVAAAGGEIRVADKHLMENYELRRESDLPSFTWVFRVKRANMEQEKASAKRWRAGP